MTVTWYYMPYLHIPREEGEDRHYVASNHTRHTHTDKK